MRSRTVAPSGLRPTPVRSRRGTARNAPSASVEAGRVAPEQLTSRNSHDRRAPFGPATAREAPIQRVILQIGDPERSGVDFPALAARLLETKGEGKSRAFGPYQHPKPGLFAKIFGSKETLYIVTHGAPDGIIGYDDADELSAALTKKGLTSSTVSKIVLVACSTGSGSKGTGGSFALDLAKATGLPVYASNKPVDVVYTEEGDFQPTATPSGFEIDDQPVAIVGGAGLIKFTPTTTELEQPLL